MVDSDPKDGMLFAEDKLESKAVISRKVLDVRLMMFRKHASTTYSYMFRAAAIHGAGHEATVDILSMSGRQECRKGR